MIKHYIVFLHRKRNPKEVPSVNSGPKSSHSYLCWWKMLVEFLRTPNIWGCVSTLSNNGRGKGLKMNIQSSLFCSSQDSGMSQTKLLFFALCHVQEVQTVSGVARGRGVGGVNVWEQFPLLLLRDGTLLWQVKVWKSKKLGIVWTHKRRKLQVRPSKVVQSRRSVRISTPSLITEPEKGEVDSTVILLFVFYILHISV